MGVSALELRRRVLMAQPHKERKTGGIVSFNTHVPQVLGVAVPLSPVQAGTGDPYPPGGGKNKYPIAIGEDVFADNGGATHSNDGGSLIINTVATHGASGVFAGNSTTLRGVLDSLEVPFTVSVEISATASGNVRLVVCGKQQLFEIGTAKRRISLTVTSKSTINFNIYGVNNGATLTASNLQAEEGSTATEYATYSNIRPISGHTGAAVCRAGKNLLDLSILRQGTFDGAINPNNVSFDEFLPIKGGLQYVWSTTIPNISGRYVRFYDATKTMISGNSLYGAGAKKFTAPENALYFRAMWYRNGGLPLADVTEDQIEPGATATEYAPFSGESFPFTFPAVGANQWDEQWEVGAYNTSTGAKTGTSAGRIRSAGFIPVVPGGKYKAVGDIDGICYYDKNKSYLSYSINNSVITIPNNCYFITFYSKTNYGSTYNHNISINYPSTVTAYEPYTTTVYGGRLEPAAGVLTVDRAMVTFDGTQPNSQFSLSEYPNSNPLRNRISWAGIYAANVGKIGGKYISDTLVGDTEYANVPLIWHVANSSALYARMFIGVPPTIMTVADWQSYVAQNPISVIYELAEPLIIPLSPAEIRALMGENNVFADTGDVDVEFWTN